MKLLQMMNNWTRELTPNFDYIAEELQLGDWVTIGRDSLTEKKDIRALPTAMHSKVLPIDALSNNMSYLILRCKDIVIGGESTSYKSINEYIPIEMIYEYKDGSRCYCILLGSNDEVVNYNMVSNLKITTVLTNLTPRYRLTLDGEECMLNIFTKDSFSDSENLLDKYNYLLFKSINPDSVDIVRLSDNIYEVTGDVTVGVLDINTWTYEGVQTIDSRMVIHSSDHGCSQTTVIEKMLVYKAISKIDCELLRNRIEEVVS